MTASSNRPVFVTGSTDKWQEICMVLKDELTLDRESIDLVEIQGSSEAIAKRKCEQAAQTLGRPVVCEDTSLVFKAFNNLPGPYIKWFLGELGPMGLYRMFKDFDDKRAEAICTLAFCEGPGKPVHLFEGRIQGKIVSPRGPTGFGWDQIFMPDNYEQTFAEMDRPFKITISYRTKALLKFKEWYQLNRLG